jgi:hypothetical protein
MYITIYMTCPKVWHIHILERLSRRGYVHDVKALHVDEVHAIRSRYQEYGVVQKEALRQGVFDRDVESGALEHLKSLGEVEDVRIVPGEESVCRTGAGKANIAPRIICAAF